VETGWATMVQFLAEGNDGIFCLCCHIQIDYRAHPTPYPMGTGGSFLGGGVKLNTNIHSVLGLRMCGAQLSRRILHSIVFR